MTTRPIGIFKIDVHSNNFDWIYERVINFLSFTEIEELYEKKSYLRLYLNQIPKAIIVYIRDCERMTHEHKEIAQEYFEEFRKYSILVEVCFYDIDFACFKVVTFRDTEEKADIFSNCIEARTLEQLVEESQKYCKNIYDSLDSINNVD